MQSYFYKCNNCNEEFGPKEIELYNHYLCPKCGMAEKNKPLRGVLSVIYDYNEIRNSYKQASMLKFTPGEFWRYPFLWPLDYFRSGNRLILKGIDKDRINSLRLSPFIFKSLTDEKLLLFDDTRNPTLSYKDRASVVLAIKALQLGKKEISAASTGNAGSSLAGICSRLGLNAHLFVPEAIPDPKRAQIQAFGANIYMVKGDYDEAFDLCLDVSEKKGWYNRNTAFNPLTIEGKKSAAIDIFIMTQGQLPDNIFVPVGDGVILAGLFKGFYDLLQLGWIEKLPRLIGVQSQKSDAIIRYLETGRFEYKPASTIADSLNAGAPRNLFMASDSITKSKGFGVRVTDEEIIAAQKKIIGEMGILVEPAAAASYAGYLKAQQSSIPLPGTSMLMLTGNGLKDIESINTIISKPESFTSKEWIEKLT